VKHVISVFVAVTVVVFGACDGDRSRGVDRANPARPGVVRLDDAQLAALGEQYPRLGPEPVPEPQPGPDADPGAVPRQVPVRVLETVLGDATYYAKIFEGRRTASGIPFRHNQMVAAHRAYPFGTILRVTNLRNRRSVNVRVVDRGPAGITAHARRTVIDLSRRAAQQLGYIQAGRAPVRLEVLEWGRGISL
jgi:rare lipoprotein A